MGHVLARSRTWSSTFAGSCAIPSHPEDDSISPARESNPAWRLRRPPCLPPHSRGARCIALARSRTWTSTFGGSRAVRHTPGALHVPAGPTAGFEPAWACLQDRSLPIRPRRHGPWLGVASGEWRVRVRARTDCRRPGGTHAPSPAPLLPLATRHSPLISCAPGGTRTHDLLADNEASTPGCSARAVRMSGGRGPPKRARRRRGRTPTPGLTSGSHHSRVSAFKAASSSAVSLGRGIPARSHWRASSGRKASRACR